MKSKMQAASQLPAKGSSDVDVAPAPVSQRYRDGDDNDILKIN